MFYSETNNPTEDLKSRPWPEGDTADLQAQESLRNLGTQRVDLEDSAKAYKPRETKVSFTPYLKALEEEMESIDPSFFNGLLKSLRGALVYELRKRALWQAPPRYLGIMGHSWDEAESIDELLFDCYEFVFVRRLGALKKQLMVRTNVDGLVFRAIRNFLHEAQKRHDPLGYRVFQITQEAIQRLLDEERLHLLGDGSRIRCNTVLTFSPWPTSEADPEVDLSSEVECWNEWLLHDLVVAHHRGPGIERLAEAVASLADRGVAAFRFRDLVEPLKSNVRSRWQALSPNFAVGQDPALDSMIVPGADYEARQQFNDLLQCTSQGLDHLQVTERMRNYLHRLLLFLRNWALEVDEATAQTDRPPSDVSLGELLEIPRNQLPKLRKMLGEVINACRRGILTNSASTAHHFEDSGRLSMLRLDERRNSLRQATAAAATRWADTVCRQIRERAEETPQPGDRFVMRSPAHMPVEWVILGTSKDEGTGPWGRNRRPKDHLLAFPVDDSPFLGSDDLELDDGEPTRLRGACKAWVSPRTFADGVFTGRLPADRLQQIRQSQKHASRASTDQLEADADPRYKTWLKALCSDAARLGQTSTSGGKILRPTAFQKIGRPFRGLAVAAALVAGLGLPFLLRSETPTPPFVLSASTAQDVTLGEVTRGADDTILKVVAGEELMVNIGLWRIEPQPPFYRMEILGQDDTVHWRSERLPSETQLILVVPEDWLPAGHYLLRIYGIDEDGVERPLEVATSSLDSW